MNLFISNILEIYVVCVQIDVDIKTRHKDSDMSDPDACQGLCSVSNIGGKFAKIYICWWYFSLYLLNVSNLSRHLLENVFVTLYKVFSVLYTFASKIFEIFYSSCKIQVFNYAK